MEDMARNDALPAFNGVEREGMDAAVHMGVGNDFIVDEQVLADVGYQNTFEFAQKFATNKKPIRGT